MTNEQKVTAFDDIKTFVTERIIDMKSQYIKMINDIDNLTSWYIDFEGLRRDLLMHKHYIGKIALSKYEEYNDDKEDCFEELNLILIDLKTKPANELFYVIERLEKQLN